MHSLHLCFVRGNSAFIMVRFLFIFPYLSIHKNFQDSQFCHGHGPCPQSPQPTTSSKRRLTLQHFATVNSDLVAMLAPNNQDARPPASDDWFSYPPTIILDALYGNAALRRWATKSIMDIIANLTKDNYYKQTKLDQEAAHAKADHTASQVVEQGERAEARGGQGSGAGEEGGQEKMDMLDFILYLSRLSGPHWQYSSEATSSTSPPSPSLEDDGIRKVEKWLQGMS